MVGVEMDSRKVAVAQADVAVTVENWTHEDGVLVVGFSVVRVTALAELFRAVVDLVVLLGAVETTTDASRVGGPVEHVLGLRNVD